MIQKTFYSFTDMVVDVCSVSSSLRQSILGDSDFPMDDEQLVQILQENIDTSEGNIKQPGWCSLPTDDIGHGYCTSGGLFFGWSPARQSNLRVFYTAYLDHPRGWYPESTLLASAWLAGWRWLDPKDYHILPDYDEAQAHRAIIHQHQGMLDQIKRHLERSLQSFEEAQASDHEDEDSIVDDNNTLSEAVLKILEKKINPFA